MQARGGGADPGWQYDNGVFTLSVLCDLGTRWRADPWKYDNDVFTPMCIFTCRHEVAWQIQDGSMILTP